MYRLALATASALLTLCGTAMAAPPDVIRIGGPSLPADTKVAIVASEEKLAGKSFEVANAGGQRVFSGQLTKAAGKTAPWKNAAAANWSSIVAPGSYTISAGDIKSRKWVVRPDGSRGAIFKILRYFAGNSDGNEPSPLHKPSHLNDATIKDGAFKGQKFDLTGGWMDAGDMVHLTQTTAYAAAALQAAARLDPGSAFQLNQAADVGIRWLLKAHPAPGLFVGQVSDQKDHDFKGGFRDPAKDDGSGEKDIAKRPAYTLGGKAGGSDAAGKTATALALAADRASGAQRATLIAAARDWYAFGKRVNRATKLKDGFYDGADTPDDLAAGAAALYRTTREPQFLAEARSFLGLANVGSGLSWQDFGPFAAADLCGALGAPAPSVEATAEACGELARAARASAKRAKTTAFGTPGIFAFGWSAENGGNGAVTAIAARAGVFPNGFQVAAGARDYLLGRNPWGTSFIVGYGPSAPKRVHHWASALKKRPTGAVVGGPTTKKILADQDPPLELAKGGLTRFNSSAAVYEDQRDNYVTSEVAIDYASASILLLASLAR